MKKFSKKEYPLKQHSGIHISAILALFTLFSTILLVWAFYLFLVNEKDLPTIIVLGFLSFISLTGLLVSFSFIFYKLKLQMAANDKVIIIKCNKKYLEFEISNIKSIFLIYSHHIMESNSTNSTEKYDHYSNYGKIGISFIDGTFYVANGHNLDYAAYLLEKFTQVQAYKIKEPHKNRFEDFAPK